MRNIIYLSAITLLTLGSCQNNAKTDPSKSEEISKEAIVLHDEIMPKIAHFDRATLKIDSLLQTNLEASTKDELIQLKANLEGATDHMMMWMKDYAFDSTNVAYQEAELVKIKAMKKQFDDVSLESNTKLSSFK